MIDDDDDDGNEDRSWNQPRILNRLLNINYSAESKRLVQQITSNTFDSNDLATSNSISQLVINKLNLKRTRVSSLLKIDGKTHFY